MIKSLPRLQQDLHLGNTSTRTYIYTYEIINTLNIQHTIEEICTGESWMADVCRCSLSL